MKNIIIIGSGPAGISSSLYTIRANIQTTVITTNNSALQKADKIENYYGFSHSISGDALYEQSVLGAKRLGVEFVEDEAVGIGIDDRFFVQTATNKYPCDGIIIATGAQRQTPKIKGIDIFDGKGISYCAICDAFFYRGRDVAVLGSGKYALNEAKELLPIAKSVTILTNGEIPKIKFPAEMKINTKKIIEFKGTDKIDTVVFEDENMLSISGVFIAYGVAGSSMLAKKIGIATENNKIITDENKQTNILGIYAVGDCTNGMLQISKAVYDGALAAMSAINFLRGNK